MSVVAPETLRERAREYAARNPEATLPEVLGYFQLDPAENSDERTLVENVLTTVEQPAASDADDEPPMRIGDKTSSRVEQPAASDADDEQGASA